MSVSWQARIASFLVRRRLKPRLADMRNIERVRRAFATPLPAPGGVRYTEAVVGGVRGEWVEAASGTSSRVTLLYVHGGGFVGCSPRTHRALTAALALQGLSVFVPDYRLAPEHPFPAAPDDVWAVWQALRSARPQDRLVVAGDSAGGNLALGLMVALRAAGQAQPAAAALFSPALDLMGESASLQLNSASDAMFDGAQLEHLMEAYLAGADAQQPLASPLRGELDGLPPLLIHVGSGEVLRDDALRLVAKAREAGVTVEFELFHGVPHVWQLLHRLPEARRSVSAAGRFLRDAVAQTGPEEIDVLIVGAGLSGVGSAVHLMKNCPAKSFTLLEARRAMGGTWDLFRYPGVRSDSDMYTLGYQFKPWNDAKAIADGAAIRQYIAETAAEHGVTPFVRYGQRVLSANWSSSEGRWTALVQRDDGSAPRPIRARFMLFCAGYYSYAQGYRPAFPGEEQYRGQIVHPQFWPEDLAYAGKRVVVIGSGATAVTLVPEMAKSAAHVTMLQRSPTYMFARPSVDGVAESLKRWLPPIWAYRLIRAKNVGMQQFFYRLARRRPQKARQQLLGLVRAALPAGYDVERHFGPRYKVWDQRVCLVPDDDLFAAISKGGASVVTDTIDSFTADGIRLASGQELQADIVVSATGLQLNVLGDVRLSVDGAAVQSADTMVYKGMMFGGVPNLANTIGYTNASWTLKADLTARYVCRLLNHMDANGLQVCTPVSDPTVKPQPFLDFTSGYVQRALPLLPRQGDRKPWQLYQNYLKDLLTLRYSRVDDGVMRFGTVAPRG